MIFGVRIHFFNTSIFTSENILIYIIPELVAVGPLVVYSVTLENNKKVTV